MNNPKLRFKGYTEAWEQRKFGDVVQVRRGLTYKPSDVQESGVRVLRSSNINGDTFVYGNDDVFVNPRTVNIETVKQNDILITSANGSSRLVGKHTLVKEIPDDSAVHGGFMLLGRTRNYDFINASMSSSWYTRFINIYVVGGNGAIGNLSKSDLDEQFILVPSDLEQKKIGVYFRSLDHLITLHQRKCEQVKKLKKYMLQNMFPKNGESVPKIRFSGFTDAWEQRKLETVTQEFKSGNSLKADNISESGKYPVYGGNGLRGYTSTYNHDGEFALIGRQGALCGNMNYSIGKAYFTEHAVVVEADEKNNTRFIYYMLDTMNLGQYSDQSAQPGLAVNKLIKLENVFPRKEEQIKIGNYFKSLDRLITLHQRKCEMLQKMKKYMLQNMFV